MPLSEKTRMKCGTVDDDAVAVVVVIVVMMMMMMRVIGISICV